jgi:AraC-like DNA-binding protein
MSAMRPRLLLHESPLGCFEVAFGAPHPRLAPDVLGYEGYRERGARPGRRRHVPSGSVVLLVNFGPAIRCVDPVDPSRSGERRDAWVGGLRDRWLWSEVDGKSHCLEVHLTPIGAQRLLGLPMHLLANRAVDLEDVLGAAARRLRDRLAEANGWAPRFALADAFVAPRFDRSRPAPAGVRFAWRRLVESQGGAPIASLARELAWSHRRLIASFREHVGLGPKRIGRVLHFRRAHRALEGSGAPGAAAVALACGYYDQAHLIHDFRELAGLTPRELVARRLGEGLGLREDGRGGASTSSKTGAGPPA